MLKQRREEARRRHEQEAPLEQTRRRERREQPSSDGGERPDASTQRGGSGEMRGDGGEHAAAMNHDPKCHQLSQTIMNFMRNKQQHMI
ncbi:hypothetical protein AHAS_Ahas09G0020300 [Arachis hypogaea]